MSSIVRDHSDHVQLFIDSLGVKGEYRRTLEKPVKTVLGEKFANDREFLNSLLENPAILGSLEKYCLYDKDVFVSYIIFREEPLEENTEFVETLLQTLYRRAVSYFNLQQFRLCVKVLIRTDFFI